MMNGQLYSEYSRLSHMLSLPPCAQQHWIRIVSWLGEHVTKLAEWSCEQVREMIRQRGDHHQWVASYDGFYLMRSHHSNNLSATLHDCDRKDCLVPASYQARIRPQQGRANWWHGQTRGQCVNSRTHHSRLAGARHMRLGRRCLVASRTNSCSESYVVR